MAEQFYKSYSRKRRVLLTEELFNAGMYYTDAPLAPGFLKLLVNYDLKDRGASLVPRPGLRTYALGLHRKNAEEGLPHTVYAPEMMLASGRQCAEVNNKTYTQVIIGQPASELLDDTRLYKGQAQVATVYANGEAYETSEQLHAPVVEGVESRDLIVAPIADVTSFKRPSTAQIHGMPLIDLTYIARHVGTFAYNNNYYYFKHDDGTPVLARTKFDDEATPGPHYTSEVVAPKQITPKEAVMWGYNMLAENPYTFENQSNAGVIQLLGLLPYDADGNLIMTPVVNQDFILECFYAAPAETYEFKWEWKEPVASSWTEIKSETLSLDGLPRLRAEFAAPHQQIMIRITATKEGTDFPEQVLTVGFNFDKEQHGSTANVKPVNYNIPQASGIAYWNHSLVVYGLKEDPTVMLLSDINDPSYFPYPQNAGIFDEPIVHVLPFLNDLLVFTSTQLHLLTANPEGFGWTSKMLQGGLDIREWDLHLIRVIKNMVFFKSGNYYYMVVPRNTGDLTIAPISKNMEGFFDNFQKNVAEIMFLLYNYEGALELVHYYNYLDFEDVHNVYVFRTDSGLYVNLTMLYSTVARAWRIYTHESQHIYMPLIEDATKKGTLMSLVPLQQTEGTLVGLQFLRYDNQHTLDFYIPENTNLSPGEEDSIEVAFEELHIFKNYQILDTGYRDQATDYNKRYRELQIKLNNISGESLRFHTDFFIDGEIRRRMYRYKTTHNVDPESPDYGLLSMEREFIDPTIVPGTTILAEDELDLNAWQLDVSVFPELSFWKIRIPVSGKGHTPRLRLVSHNALPYELLGVSWVFRPLYAR